MYDSVDLKYLDLVMINLNFPILWRKMDFIMYRNGKCVCSCEWVPDERVSYQTGALVGGPSFSFCILIGDRRVQCIDDRLGGRKSLLGL